MNKEGARRTYEALEEARQAYGRMVRALVAAEANAEEGEPWERRRHFIAACRVARVELHREVWPYIVDAYDVVEDAL